MRKETRKINSTAFISESDAPNGNIFNGFSWKQQQQRQKRQQNRREESCFTYKHIVNLDDIAHKNVNYYLS